jgi:bacillithiol system protein YtxJ
MQPARFAGKHDLDTALAAPLFLVFKHSLACSVSARAFSVYTAFADAHPDVPTNCIEVVEQRPLSRHVEASTGVRHESPQALLIRNGAVAFSAAHFAITVEALERATSDG